LFAELDLGHLVAMHFVRAVGEAQRARPAFAATFGA
jgi:hypothetical protein